MKPRAAKDHGPVSTVDMHQVVDALQVAALCAHRIAIRAPRRIVEDATACVAAIEQAVAALQIAQSSSVRAVPRPRPRVEHVGGGSVLRMKKHKKEAGL